MPWLSRMTKVGDFSAIFPVMKANILAHFGLKRKDIKKINEYNEYILPYSTRYEKMYSSLYQLSKINYIKDLNDFKNFFKKENMTF